MNSMLTELIGLAASLLAFASMTFKDIKFVRIFNSVGCILFFIYGVQINSISIILLNVGCIVVNIYHLYRIYKNKSKGELNNGKE